MGWSAVILQSLTSSALMTRSFNKLVICQGFSFSVAIKMWFAQIHKPLISVRAKWNWGCSENKKWRQQERSLWVPLSFIFIQMMQFYSPRSHLQETWFWQRCDFTISRMSPDYSRACADFYLQSLSSLITLLKLNPTHWQWCSQKRSIMILTPRKKCNSSLKTLQDKRKHKQHRVTGMNKILWGQFGRCIDQ